MTTDYCAVCYVKVNVKACTGCQSCVYCSKACQALDWPSHKRLCGAIAQQDSRPSANHVRGIFFPADRKTPELVWVPCDWAQDPFHIDSLLLVDNPDVPKKLQPNDEVIRNSWIGGDSPWDVGTEHVRHNLRLRKVAPRLLRFYFRDNFYNDGSVPTASLAATVRPHGQETRDWRGPLLVVAFSASPDGNTLESGGDSRIDDMNLADLRGVVDYSLGYGALSGSRRLCA